MAAFIALNLVGYATRVASPYLLAHAPLLLAVLDGRTSTSLLLVDRLPVVVFVLGATAGFVLGDLLVFSLGRIYGNRTTEKVGRWLPTTGRLVKFVERFMGKTKGAPLIATSGYAACAVAGASGVAWSWFLLFNLLGVALRLAIVLGVAHSFESKLGRVGEWIDEFAVPLTGVMVLLVAADLALGWHKNQRVRQGE